MQGRERLCKVKPMRPTRNKNTLLGAQRQCNAVWTDTRYKRGACEWYEEYVQKRKYYVEEGLMKKASQRRRPYRNELSNFAVIMGEKGHQ